MLLMLIQGPDENLNHPVIEDGIREFIYSGKTDSLASEFPGTFKDRVPNGVVALFGTAVRVTFSLHVAASHHLYLPGFVLPSRDENRRADNHQVRGRDLCPDVPRDPRRRSGGA